MGSVKGSIQEIRMSRGGNDPSEYLVQEHVVDDRYNIAGNNDPYEDLAGELVFVYSGIPGSSVSDPVQTGGILDAQMESIRDHGKS